MPTITRDIKCPTCGVVAGKPCISVNGKLISDMHRSRRLISINEAVKLGHPRLRKPIWANRFDHLKIDIIDGAIGPWLHLYAPFNQECNGRDPVNMLALEWVATFNTPEFEVYDGPLPDSEEYRAEVARFAELGK
jgi:hypothetical protein